MKRIILPMLCLGMSAGMATLAEGTVPPAANVAEGSFHCFPPGAPVEYVKAPASGLHKVRRVEKLGNSKWDNTDGHDLREIPTEGSPEILVILVEFPNVKFSSSIGDPRARIDEMLNGENYNYNGASGSARNFYSYTSGGKFTPNFHVVGPVTCKKNEAEYVNSSVPDIIPGTDKQVYAPSRMIEEAIRGVDDEIDFTKFDTNNDGYVDFVYVFFAGRGATTGGNSATTIWPHAFTLTSGLGAPVELDGIKIDRYCCSAELGSNGKLSGIGTFCHEFGHVLGLPDLYDTANNGSASKCFTPGTFDCMDGGNYNNNEHTPATFSLYEQYALEWTLPKTITGSANLTLLPLSARPFGYKVPTVNNPCEYFLFENRGPIHNDKYLEGHGMLIWHIDYVAEAWANNVPNNNANHQRIDIEEADGRQDINSRIGDPFPGNTGKHEFQSIDSPGLIDWNYESTGYEVTLIQRHPDGTVSFRVEAEDGKEMPGTNLASATAEIVKTTTTGARLQWAPVEGATGYMVSVYDLSKFDGNLITDYVDGYCFLNVGESLNVDIKGLEPGKSYGAYVYALNDANASRPAFPVEFSTLSGENSATAATNIYVHNDADLLTVTWDVMEDADSYELTIALPIDMNKDSEEKLTFEGSILPQGWVSNAGFDDRDKYCGEAAPALRPTITGQYLTSPMGDYIKELSFWARKHYDDPLYLDIYGIDANGNKHIVKRIEDLTTKGTIYNIEFPDGYVQMQIVFMSQMSGASVFIDDMTLSRSKEGKSYNPCSNLDITYYSKGSAIVKGLSNDVTYAAYVTPMIKTEEGLKPGQRSNVLLFTPSKALSGIDEIEDSNATEFYISNGMIIPGSEVAYDLYSIDGMQLAKGLRGAYSLPARGIYIVRTANKSVKICR